MNDVEGGSHESDEQLNGFSISSETEGRITKIAFAVCCGILLLVILIVLANWGAIAHLLFHAMAPGQ